MEQIVVQPDLPYFLTEGGDPWTPIGHNDAITWPDLAGLFRGRDLPGVEAYLLGLKASGVTCLRLMLEYCQGEHRYLEKPVGRFVPNMVRLWDDLFVLLERVGLRALLTPYDTFFMWLRWRNHPYNRRNGGPCAHRRDWLTSSDMREAIKARLAFASDRWGASPALFAWDLWNEIHPAHAGNDPAAVVPFIDDVAPWLRRYEHARHGRAHLQGLSVFGPELIAHPKLCDPIFRHPALDFATTHLYEAGTIDAPRDTVAPAVAVGRLMAAAIGEIADRRPVFDSEHGPIHSFKDLRRTLPETFDDEYFRHIQWAHLASGGAGGGMRWPNRHPHVLTAGMREAQRALAQFLPLIDWATFRRRTLNTEIACDDPGLARFGCGSQDQALLWLLRTDTLRADGTVAPARHALPVTLTIPGLDAGGYAVTTVPSAGAETQRVRAFAGVSGALTVLLPPVSTDLAIAIRRE